MAKALLRPLLRMIAFDNVLGSAALGAVARPLLAPTSRPLFAPTSGTDLVGRRCVDNLHHTRAFAALPLSILPDGYGYRRVQVYLNHAKAQQATMPATHDATTRPTPRAPARVGRAPPIMQRLSLIGEHSHIANAVRHGSQVHGSRWSLAKRVGVGVRAVLFTLSLGYQV
jgi:hypothetical protein